MPQPHTDNSISLFPSHTRPPPSSCTGPSTLGLNNATPFQLTPVGNPLILTSNCLDSFPHTEKVSAMFPKYDSNCLRAKIRCRLASGPRPSLSDLSADSGYGVSARAPKLQCCMWNVWPPCETCSRRSLVLLLLDDGTLGSSLVGAVSDSRKHYYFQTIQGSSYPMASSTSYRRAHRKRVSALRLSSDSTVPALPLYTSPSWSRPLEYLEDPSDRPPDYSDSAEEADDDTDGGTSDLEANSSRVLYVPSTPPLSFSPRRSTRRSQSSRTSGSARRLPTPSAEPYIDSLLARSIHALEMSNTLLQSSMSTQTTLSHVLSSGSPTHDSLEVHARKLSARIHGNDNVQDSWAGNLEEISKGVESLFQDGDGASGHQRDDPISQSLPTNGLAPLADRVKQSHLRRPSLDFRSPNASSCDSHLNLSDHHRNDLIAPAPRAFTIYVDSSDDPSVITLPQTLGLRSATQFPPTPLPAEIISPKPKHLDVISASASPPRRAVDLLSSYIARTTNIMRKSSTGSNSTLSQRNIRRAKSPPPNTTAPPSSSHSSPSRRSRSLTPLRGNSPSLVIRTMTPPIEELSASSDSSTSDTLHVDRTLECLRHILEKQPPRPASATPSIQTRPRPSFLIPPVVEPTSGTSTATASVSRLFTKGRHSSSTRPPSPPRHSSMKSRSTPPTPNHTPSPSVSMLSVSDAIVNGLGLGSGHSTPKRISFAELPESYASSRSRSGSSPTRTSSNSSGSRASKRKGKHRVLDKGGGEGNPTGWLYEWLFSATGTGPLVGSSSSRTSPSESFLRQDERFTRNPMWASRPGFGSSIEDWAV